MNALPAAFFSRFRRAPIAMLSVFFALFALSCVAAHDEGGECLFNDDCASPLVCAAQFCRAQCAGPRDCPAGEDCGPSGQSGVQVCLAPDAPRPCSVDSECPTPFVCGPRGVCHYACHTDYDCRVLRRNYQCVLETDAGEGSCRPAPRADAGPVVDTGVDAPIDGPVVDAGDAGDAGCALAHARAVVSGGACVIGACDPGYADCDGITADGCEAPLASSSSDCGACGRVCAGSGEQCTGGVCAVQLRSIAAGPDFSCAIGIGATGVRCWGRGDVGQLGNGATADARQPTSAGVFSAAVAPQSIALGADHACALVNNGQVYCWGSDASGQLGDGQPASTSSTPVLVPGVSLGVSVAAGAGFTCVARADGTVTCWGENARGQLGDGTVVSQSTPATQVSGITDARAVIAGDAFACALRATGEVACWGDDSAGQLGDGGAAMGMSATPVALTAFADAHRLVARGVRACAVRGAGQVSCWGGGMVAGVPLPGLSDAQDVALGDAFACVVRAASLDCWGDNHLGQFGDRTATSRSTLTTVSTTPAVSIAAGAAHLCAMATDGTVRCAGDNSRGQVGVGTPAHQAAFSAATRVVGLDANPASAAASTGDGTACAIDAAGTTLCWGVGSMLGSSTAADQNAPVLVPGLPAAAVLSTGGGHGCTVTPTGEVWCWGDNSFGQLGSGAASGGARPAVAVLGVGGASSISCGGFHTCAVFGSPGMLACWGDNLHGQLGDGTTMEQDSPVATMRLSGVTSVSAGETHTCSTRSDGAVLCWGANESGQLGRDTAGADATVPDFVTGFTGAQWISAGRAVTCAVDGAFGVECWGDGSSGQLGPNASGPSASPVIVPGLPMMETVTVGAAHVCALTLARDQVWCWGDSSLGQTGHAGGAPAPVDQLPPGVGIAAVSTGPTSNSTCAVLVDGSTWCWGDDSRGQVGEGGLDVTTLTGVPGVP